MTDHRWKPGQEVILDDREVVKVERVTPSGRAVIGRRAFYPDGKEVGRSGSPWRPSVWIDPATPERLAELAQREADEKLRVQFWDAFNRLEKYARHAFRKSPYQAFPELTPADRTKLVNLIAIMDHVTGHNAEKKGATE